MQEFQKPANGDTNATCDPVLVATLAEALALLVKKLMVKDSFLIVAEEGDLETLLELLSETQVAAENFLGVTDVLI